ncbi:MAG: response regulator transcription factor [Mycobacteriaceae bacterium]|nr:response regulator transcription factor [Mycobacteriaceae bacterium]MBV9639682.1 response regulator transcription factor [Mycobacteriaceae bacterium]
MRAVIIDDHDVVHAGIEAWCANADPPIEFVDNFVDPQQFLQRYPQPDDDVDVVLFDLQIDSSRPDFDTLRRLCESGRRVIIYSHITTDEIILTCLDIGAVTYLVKSEGKAHLIEAIHAASSTTPYLGPRMAKALLNDRAAGRPSLSQREKEVLVAWFQTESKDLVAKRLYIAPSTVRTHLQRVRAKYAAAGRPAPTKSALLARAIEDGILSLHEV